MRLVLLLLAGCSSSPPTPTPKPSPSAQLLVEVGRELQWFSVDTALHKQRTVALPAAISKLELVGRDPVLQFYDDDRIGIVTAAGLEFITLPPDSTWTRPTPHDGATAVAKPSPRMFTKNGEVWVSRCPWIDEGGLFSTCAGNVEVRIRPLPIVTVLGNDPPPLEPNEIPRPSPPIAPSTAISAVLVPDIERHQGKRPKLQCTDNTVTIEDPPIGSALEIHGDVQTEHGRTDLIWLSTDPPIFQISDHDFCMPCPTPVIFERCVRSTRYEWVTIGPDNLLAFHASNVTTRKLDYTLFRAGRVLGTIEGVGKFAFLP